MEKKIITVKELIEQNTEQFSKNIAYRMKRDNVYREWTYEDVGRCIRNLSAALSKLGVSKGDKIALVSENRPEWPISYLSIAYLGAVVVPLDALSQAKNLLYLIKDSGAKAIILSQKFLDLFGNSLNEAPELKNIISMDAKEDKGKVLSYERLITEQKKKPESKVEVGDILAILYTSGTTGVSKGVMLSHSNIMSNVKTVCSLVEIRPDDNLLSVLPLHHTFETTCGFLTPFFSGAAVTYAESLKSYNLLKNMQETKVTLMCGVPLLYKLFFDGILREVEEKGIVAKALFGILFFVSRVIKSLTGLNIGRILFSMVHKKLGRSIRFWVSGGAAIDPKIIKGFDLMGITILQGYGLTESSPIITCSTLKDNRIGSIGKAMTGIEVKIDKPNEQGIGEIIAKGPNIMKGYYKREDLTAEVIKNGWLYTGDVGYIDKDGYVYITGRIKDVIVTGTGLNVYPEEVELELDRSPFVKESCILGRKVKIGAKAGMEEVFAIVLPDVEYFEKYGKAKNIEIDQDFIRRKIGEEIKKVNDALPEYKKIANFELRSEDFPKTSTRKIKRFVVRKEYRL